MSKLPPQGRLSALKHRSQCEKGGGDSEPAACRLAVTGGAVQQAVTNPGRPRV